MAIENSRAGIMLFLQEKFDIGRQKTKLEEKWHAQAETLAGHLTGSLGISKEAYIAQLPKFTKLRDNQVLVDPRIVSEEIMEKIGITNSVPLEKISYLNKEVGILEKPYITSLDCEMLSVDDIRESLPKRKRGGLIADAIGLYIENGAALRLMIAKKPGLLLPGIAPVGNDFYFLSIMNDKVWFLRTAVDNPHKKLLALVAKQI